MTDDADLLDRLSRILAIPIPPGEPEPVITISQGIIRRLLPLAREAHERREWLAGVQRTHHAECWRSHHECAVAKVEELETYIANERT